MDGANGRKRKRSDNGGDNPEELDYNPLALSLLLPYSHLPNAHTPPPPEQPPEQPQHRFLSLPLPYSRPPNAHTPPPPEQPPEQPQLRFLSLFFTSFRRPNAHNPPPEQPQHRLPSLFLPSFRHPNAHTQPPEQPQHGRSPEQPQQLLHRRRSAAKDSADGRKIKSSHNGRDNPEELDFDPLASLPYSGIPYVHTPPPPEQPPEQPQHGCSPENPQQSLHRHRSLAMDSADGRKRKFSNGRDNPEYLDYDPLALSLSLPYSGIPYVYTPPPPEQPPEQPQYRLSPEQTLQRRLMKQPQQPPLHRCLPEQEQHELHHRFSLEQPQQPLHHHPSPEQPQQPLHRRPPVQRHQPQHRRRAKSHEPSSSHPPPFPWETGEPCKVHTLKHLKSHGITTVNGDSQCQRCGQRTVIQYDISSKFKEVARFIIARKDEIHQRAPAQWTNPVLPDCGKCDQPNCMRPVVAEKEEINWLFLLLDVTLGCCSLDQIKYFCKHTGVHRTGAKDRVLYEAYLGLCKQLDPDGPFDLYN